MTRRESELRAMFALAAPLVLTKEILPVQDAAVPLEDAVAVLTTLSCAVSELPSPTGGKLNDRVVVVDVVWAKAPTAVRAASASVVDRDRLRSMLYLSLVLLEMKAAFRTDSPFLMRIRTGRHLVQFRNGRLPLRS